MSGNVLLSFQQDVDKTEVDQKTRGKINAPFLLTLMNDNHHGPLFWLWARRHKNWVIEQELNLKTRRRSPKTRGRKRRSNQSPNFIGFGKVVSSFKNGF